jgi:HlyD family secretion protein
MKKKFVAVSALLIIGVAGACAPQPTIETRQQILPVERGDLVVRVSADGSLVLPEQRDLTFATAGTIKEILVGEGDSVTEGQVLARLDTVDLERAVADAEQALRSQELMVRSLEIDLAQYGRDAQAAIRNAEIELEKATDAYRRITYPYSYTTFTLDIPEALGSINQVRLQLEELKAMISDGLDESEVDTALLVLMKALDDLANARDKLSRGAGSDIFGDPSTGGILPVTSYWTLKAAQQTMEQAEVALEKLSNSIVSGTEKAEVAVENARLNLQTARNRLDLARDELSKAELRAPYNGIVAAVPARAGEVLAASYASRTVVKIVNPHHMEIEAEVDEIDVPDVRIGQTGVISVDALPGLEMTGEVTFISLLARQESGLVVYRVKVGFEVSDGVPLREGMTATVDIITSERQSVLLVPDRAIIEDSQGNLVVKVMVDGQVEERPVVVGASDGIQTEIIQGLAEGEQVVEEIRIRTQSPGLFGG